MNFRHVSVLAALLASTGPALAQQVTIDINRITSSGVGDKIGTIAVTENTTPFCGYCRMAKSAGAEECDRR